MLKNTEGNQQTKKQGIQTTGKKIYELAEMLYPICRSITGEGVRISLNIINKKIPLVIHEIPSGKKVFDWTIPKEWNINNAWIENSNGKRLVDFNDSNLHVLNYSIPVDRKVALDELKQHLYTLPEQPDLIPYRTSYYEEKWGFCICYNQYTELEEDTYHVFIDSTLEEGSLTYGELFIEGKSTDEVIISSHICHPSLANDNLSGVSVAVQLADWLLNKELQYSYRFLFIPGTIGSITWLAQNEQTIDHIKYGLVLSCIGDSGNITYKKSRQHNAGIDRIVEKVLSDHAEKYEIRNFTPYGYDERQFCSPAFNLPVGCFMRTPHGEFPEYHTSADNMELVKPEALYDSFSILERIIYTIENNRKYINLNPECEPNLGKRGLYKLTGGKTENEINQLAILWVLNLSDGNHSLLDISERSQMRFESVKRAADALVKVRLLEEINNNE